MILAGIGQALWILPLLALGLGASAIALARHGERSWRPAPLARLLPWDFLAAAVLLFGTGWAAVRLLLEEGEAPGLVFTAGVTAVGGLAAWAWLRIRGGPMPSEGRAFGWRWTLLAYLALVPGLIALWIFNAWLVDLLTGGPAVQSVVVEVQERTRQGVDPGLGLWLLSAVLVQPVIEEALFRGYLWGYLAGRRDFGPRRALLFSALAFALMHDPVVWLPLASLGLFFGWIYWRTGDVRQAMLAHALHNGTQLALGILLGGL